mmetsp:Transcript_18650/g.19295  ORF Transcript_18650/g.19295 Transcript_18650/m.19295 type:complete len:272 (+) Transcript_18650:13-828(+)
MHYLKLNDEIKDLIQLIPEVQNKKIFLGCKPFCKSQIIATDEFELLRKLLKENNIKDISSEEFKRLKSSTKVAYFLNHHVCSAPCTNNTQKSTSSELSTDKDSEESQMNEEEILKELARDKIPEKEKPGLFDPNIDYDNLNKLQKEINEESGKYSFSTRESNLNYGINILGSFLLIAIGTYCFCDFILGLKKETTLKITIVVTIVVLIAEAFLLIIRLDKDTKREIRGKGLDKKSFAYKFNREYRERVDKELQERKERRAVYKVYNKEKIE